jgi:hypothetical protein
MDLVLRSVPRVRQLHPFPPPLLVSTLLTRLKSLLVRRPIAIFSGRLLALSSPSNGVCEFALGFAPTPLHLARPARVARDELAHTCTCPRDPAGRRRGGSIRGRIGVICGMFGSGVYPRMGCGVIGTARTCWPLGMASRRAGRRDAILVLGMAGAPVISPSRVGRMVIGRVVIIVRTARGWIARTPPASVLMSASS